MQGGSLLLGLLPGPAAYRIDIPVEENVQLRVLGLDLLDLAKHLTKRQVALLVDLDMYLLLHIRAPGRNGSPN